MNEQRTVAIYAAEELTSMLSLSKLLSIAFLATAVAGVFSENSMDLQANLLLWQLDLSTSDRMIQR